MLGTSESLGAYETWAKANKLPVVVDELGKEGRLFWISERRNDKVILFLHGMDDTFQKYFGIDISLG